MADVFISYAQEDRALSAELAGALVARGYTVWWDVNLVSGPSFRGQIHTQLIAARCVIVIWSKYSVASKWVCDEADEAARLTKLIPSRTPKLEIYDIPMGHRQAQTCFIHERERIYQALADMGVKPSNETKVQRNISRFRFGKMTGVSIATLAGAGIFLALIANTYLWRANIGQQLPDIQKIEDSEWLRARQLWTTEAMRGYLNRYPHGFYSDKALALVTTEMGVTCVAGFLASYVTLAYYAKSCWIVAQADPIRP